MVKKKQNKTTKVSSKSKDVKPKKPKKEVFSQRQKDFCDNYIKYGEVLKAAVEAGYSESYGRTTASRILDIPRCKEYIAKRMASHEKATIASQEEVLEFLTKTMKGEVKDQFELDPQLRDRIEAAKQLQKRYEIVDKNKPKEVNEFQGIPAKVMSPAFLLPYHSIRNKEFVEYILKGGRGSTKSTFISEMIIELLEDNPTMHALAMRQVGNTMRDSVFAQINWAINEMNLSDEYTSTVSPMEITKKSTGQKIYFRGGDDPNKIKSIKVPFGYIGIVWFEELDQFKGEEEIRKIEQSALRGGDIGYKFKSFNPPKTAMNWANKYVDKANQKELAYIHHSDYMTVPKDWLGQLFIDEAEHLKELNYNAYEHEYLGVVNGNGGMVFDNLVIREITDEEIKKFDSIYNGTDWGWYPDPYHFSRVHYDAARLTLYIFVEYRCNKQSNLQTANKLKELGITSSDLITCDSAEEKSVGDYRAYGLSARGCDKWPGSVDYTMKWLQSLRAIVIDDKRCPYTATEFKEYEYPRDKDGNVITGYPDVNNHAIDSVRYATNPIWKRRGQ